MRTALRPRAGLALWDWREAARAQRGGNLFPAGPRPAARPSAAPAHLAGLRRGFLRPCAGGVGGFGPRDALVAGPSQLQVRAADPSSPGARWSEPRGGSGGVRPARCAGARGPRPRVLSSSRCRTCSPECGSGTAGMPERKARWDACSVGMPLLQSGSYHTWHVIYPSEWALLPFVACCGVLRTLDSARPSGCPLVVDQHAEDSLSRSFVQCGPTKGDWGQGPVHSKLVKGQRHQR